MSVSNAAPSAVSTSETTPAISRTNIILIVILLLQVAVSAYLFWPSSAAKSEGIPLLTDVTTDAVTGLTITDDNDRSVNFVKTDGVWTLADTDGFPANSDKITQTLDKLVAIASDRLVTQTPASQARLQVAEDNYLRKVDITTASGVQTLYLGSSTGASSTHVRASTEDATYLTNEVATWELDTLPTTWIDVTYYKVPKEQISEVTLKNASGTFTFIRNGADWTLADASEGELIASANISTLIDRVSTLNLHSVLGKRESPEYGLSTPLAMLTVSTIVTSTGTTSDTTVSASNTQTKTTTLVVGAKDDENSAYYFKSSDSDFYVRLAAFTGDEFVNKQRSDFMVQADSATEGATEDASAAPEIGPVAGPSPEAAAPAVTVTDVPTDTSEVESGTTPDATPNATVAATGAATNTGELEEATAEPTVSASDATTDTTDTTETPVSTGTPTN